MVVQEAAERPGHPTAQAQAFLHLRAAQIHVAVAQAQFLGGILMVLVELEGRGLGAVQDRHTLTQDLDHPRGTLAVLRARRARPNPAADHEDVLTPRGLSEAENLRRIRVENDLDQALAVAQVNKDDTTVVAALLHPAAQGDVLPDVPLVEHPAIVTAHAIEPHVR